MSTNPFEIIEARLANIENLLLDIKRPPKTPELPDSCGINEACIILGTTEKPASRAKIYQLTHLRKVSFKHFGRALVFSRRELLAYRDANTLPPSSPVDELNANLVKSAEKHLRNDKRI